MHPLGVSHTRRIRRVCNTRPDDRPSYIGVDGRIYAAWRLDSNHFLEDHRTYCLRRLRLSVHTRLPDVLLFDTPMGSLFKISPWANYCHNAVYVENPLLISKFSTHVHTHHSRTRWLTVSVIPTRAADKLTVRTRLHQPASQPRVNLSCINSETV